MRTSSTRLRFSVALAATALGLLSLGGSALADNGRSDDHRPDGAGAERTGVPTEVAGDDDSRVPDPAGDTDNAHPSGRDRHEAKGTQGHSASDPDDDGRGPDRTNGGADKPLAIADGPGGRDRLDQDGNNGCGNDDDFEDDNEGWCGGQPRPAGGPTSATSTTTIATSTTVTTVASRAGVNPVAGEVLGVTLERTATSAVPAAASAPPTGPQAAGATLARTRFPAATLAGVGLVLLAVGMALATTTRRPPGRHDA